MPRSGSYNRPSLQDAAAKETNKLIPEDILTAQDKNVDALKHIEDTYTTRSALNPQSYPEEFKMLLAYPRGTPVRVTYFFQSHSDIDIKSAPSDLSGLENSVHKDLTEVRNFEIRMLNEIEYDFRDDDNSFNITASALVYPGKTPHMGDVFFFDVGDNKIIVFNVNNVTPTTYRQGTYFQIDANSTFFLTDELADSYRSNVKEVRYFDKRKYLDGHQSLLSTQSYKDLHTLQLFRQELIEVYMNKFYKEDWESVVRPDNVYDAYLVEFLKNKISLSDYKRRPSQLDTGLLDYDKCIWYKLSSSIVPDILDDIEPYAHTKFFRAKALSPTNNARDNRYCIAIGAGAENEDTQPYVFSLNFYNHQIDLLDESEYLIYRFLKRIDIQPNEVIEVLSTYRKLPDDKKFYYIPAYISVIDEVILTLE